MAVSTNWSSTATSSTNWNGSSITSTSWADQDDNGSLGNILLEDGTSAVLDEASDNLLQE